MFEIYKMRQPLTRTYYFSAWLCVNIVSSILVVVAFVIVLVYVYYTFKLKSQNYEIQIKRDYRQKKRISLALIGKAWKVKHALLKVKGHNNLHKSKNLYFYNARYMRRMWLTGKGTDWYSPKWRDVPFRKPFSHFFLQLINLKVNKKTVNLPKTRVKGSLINLFIFNYKKQIKIRKVFQVWKKRMSIKYFKAANWKLRYRKLNFPWARFLSAHILIKRIKPKLFILPPVSVL